MPTPLHRCASCGRVARDAYPLDPRTGCPAVCPLSGLIEGGRRWCADCYERLAASASRERYAAEPRARRD